MAERNAARHHPGMLMHWCDSYGLSMWKVLTFDCSAPTGPISVVLIGTTEAPSEDMSKITSDRQVDGCRLLRLPLHLLYFIISNTAEFTLEARRLQVDNFIFVNSVHCCIDLELWGEWSRCSQIRNCSGHFWKKPEFARLSSAATID